MADEEDGARRSSAAAPRAARACRCRGRWSARRAPARWPAARTGAPAAPGCARRRESVRTGELARARARTGSRRGSSSRASCAPADLDPLAARADRVGERRVEVERAAHLVEVGDLEPRALAHGARGRLQLAEDQLEQRRLAGAVRADQADLVAAQDRRREVADDRRFARGRPAGRRSAARRRFSSATILPLGMPASTSSRTWPSDSRRAARCARSACRRWTRPTLRVRRASTPLRTQTSSCASSLSARALASASAASCSSFRRLVGAEVAGIAAQHAAIELDDAGRDRVEEGAVVRDRP